MWRSRECGGPGSGLEPAGSLLQAWGGTCCHHARGTGAAAHASIAPALASPASRPASSRPVGLRPRLTPACLQGSVVC